MNDAELRAALASHKFYHCIDVREGIRTPGNPIYLQTQDMVLAQLRALKLAGKRVLDIGCRDGLFSFEAERRGAAEVVGIDNNLSRGAIEVLIPAMGSRVRMHEKNVLDLAPEDFGRFDVVVFAGVLYHLRYPVWSLRKVRDVLVEGGTLLLETAVWRGIESHPLLYCPVDDNPYEPTSCTYFNVPGLATTLESIGLRVKAVQSLSRHAGVRGWRLRQRLLQLRKRWRGDKSLAYIDRAVFVCERAGEGPEELRRYWDSTHDFHTVYGG